jgi:[protein-PII] uridylyltransferase
VETTWYTPAHYDMSFDPSVARPAHQAQLQTLEDLASVQWGDTPREAVARVLKSARDREVAAIEQRVRRCADDSGLDACQAYTHVVDELLRLVYEGLLRSGLVTQPLAIAAVGSYARETLALASDVDVRFLVPLKSDGTQAMVEAVLYPLWDAGIDIGHQIVEADGDITLALRDLPTATSLLDWRYVAGDAQLSERFQDRVFREIFNARHLPDFVQRLRTGLEQRRARFGDTVFLLEPELKSGSGGLRDLDVLRWVARARWRVTDLSDLVRIGVLLPLESQALGDALDFMVRVRNLLHCGNRRRQDRLGFTEQRLAADRLGYGTDTAAIEAFMSAYYRHAKVIEGAVERVLARATPQPRTPASMVQDGEFTLSPAGLDINDVDRIFMEPGFALRAYNEAIARDVSLCESSRQAIFRACSVPGFCAQLRVDPEAIRCLRVLLAWDKPTPMLRHGSVIRELREVGILQAMIPEFGAILARVQHDAHHVYTVDVHSLVAVDVLRRLRSPVPVDDGSGTRVYPDHPYVQQVAAHLEQPESLFWALLLHDIGKEVKGRGHAERGAVMARDIVERIGLSPDERLRVEFLIRHHLKMYLYAFRRDLSDAATIARFASKFPDLRTLDDLFIVSYCDVVATSPGAVNDWKLRMLAELHQAAQVAWAQQHGLSDEAARAGAVPAWAGVFELRTPLDILERSTLVQETAQVAWAFRLLGTEPGVAYLTFFGDDGPGLLAKIAAVFAARKVKVVTAQLHSYVAEDGRHRVINVFGVQNGHDEVRLERECKLYEEDFGKLVQSPNGPQGYLQAVLKDARWSPREAPKIGLRVRLDNRESLTHTIVEVVANDRADVMFWVAECLHRLGLEIDRAKVHVEGARVTQAFYVRRSVGGKVEGEQAERELRHAVTDALGTALGMDYAA